jgi:hypothetical protein
MEAEMVSGEQPAPKSAGKPTNLVLLLSTDFATNFGSSLCSWENALTGLEDYNA